MGFFRDLFGARAAEPFEPVNDLERAMVAFMDGSGSLEAWVSALVASHVFILLEGEQAPDSDQGKVLLVRAQKGYDAAALFTSTERSLRLQKQRPDYRTGASVEFSWILKTIPGGIGIVFNRGWEATLELPPDGVAELRRDVIGDA